MQGAGSCAGARRLLLAAVRASRDHFRFEEQSVFPLLENVLLGETLTELGATWSQHSEVLSSAS